jgi:outer membrane protein assembly factor BamB
MKRATPIKSTILLTILLSVFSQFAVAADAPIWTYTGAKWYSMMETGNLMVGTETNILMLDGATGKTLWQRDDLKGIKEDEFHELSGTPLLLLTDNSGTFGRKTKFFAVDTLTGKTVWETEKMQGYTVNVSPNYAKDMLIILTILDNRMNRDKPDIFALKLSTGEILWKSEYSEKVDLYGVMKKGRSGVSAALFGSGSKRSDRFDLSGENAPIFDGDSMYLTYAGLHRYNLADGKLLWKNAYDVTDGALKNTNGQAIIENDVIYTSAKGIIRAINKTDGTIKWQTKDYGKGGIAEMQVWGDTIYGRMGGQFFETKKGEYQRKGPIGVVALNKNGGSEIWIYKDAKESITNMTVLQDQNILLIGDEKNLIGLDLSSQGRVKEAYKIPLKFKLKVGAGATAAKIAKIGFGGIRGAFSKGPDSIDEPVALIRQENGTVVARGKQHLLAFNPSSKEIAWSAKFDAPSIPAWQTAVMTAITAFTVALSQANKEIAASQNNWSSVDNGNTTLIGALQTYEKYMVERTTATKQSGNNVYILTDIKGKDDKGKDDKGAGLVGVNLMTGQALSQIMFKDKDPDYEVDEISGRLFNLNKNVISVYKISESVETAKADDDGKDK